MVRYGYAIQFGCIYDRTGSQGGLQVLLPSPLYLKLYYSSCYSMAGRTPLMGTTTRLTRFRHVMVNSSAFPLEIYFEIIDAIAGDKLLWDASITVPATLRACALTCSAWLNRARLRMYEDVEISEQTHPDQIRSFAQTLIDFPASAALVKRLCIHLGEFETEHWKNEEDALAIFPPEAIRQLTALQSLDFQCLDWLGPGCEPSLLSAVFAFSIATSVDTLLLAGFTFEALKVLVNHLKNFGHIHALVFITTSWISHEVPASEIGPDFLPNLNYLEVRLMSDRTSVSHFPHPQGKHSLPATFSKTICFKSCLRRSKPSS